MSPDELGALLARSIEGAEASVSFGQVTIDVPAAQWTDAATAVRDDALAELLRRHAGPGLQPAAARAAR